MTQKTFVGIYLEPSLKKVLAKMAVESGMSMSGYLRLVLSQHEKTPLRLFKSRKQ